MSAPRPTRAAVADRPRLDRLLVVFDVVRISARTQWEDTRTSPFLILLSIVQPAVFLLIALAPQGDPTPAEVTRVAFGVLLTSFWGSTIWAAAGILRRDRSQGTLARALTGVHDPLIVILGKSVSASLVAAGGTSLTLALVLGAWRQPVQLADAPLLVVGAVAVLASGTAIGILIGSLFLLTRHGPALSSALMYPVFLLGGLLVPLAEIPSSLRWMSWLISLRWLQQYFVSTSAGKPDGGALAAAVLLTAAYTAAGALLFRHIVDIARRQGSLDLV